TFLLALILIGSPVAGLRPMRAARLRTCRMPRPLMRMRSPFLRCFTRRSTRSLRIVSACFFGTSWVSARDAARCLRVTVVGVAAFAMVGKLPVLALSYFEETPNHARRIDTRFVAAGHAKNALFIEETCRQQRFRRCLLHWALRRQDGDLRRFSGHFRHTDTDRGGRKGPETPYLSRKPVDSHGTAATTASPTRIAATVNARQGREQWRRESPPPRRRQDAGRQPRPRRS